MKLSLTACCLFVVCLNILHAEPPEATIVPTRRVVDLKIGEAAEVTLAGGGKATVKLLDVQEKRDSMSGAVREAKVKVEVNGQEEWLSSANYNLPKTVGGVQVDCPITRGYNSNSGEDS